MSEFKGTKGRWYTSHRQKRNSSMYDTEVYCEKGKTIAVISWYQREPVKEIYEGREVLVTRTDREANALLISKAPEMLEMLIKLTSTMDYRNIDEAKQLIKEATEL